MTKIMALTFLTTFAALCVSRVAKCEFVVALEPEHPAANEDLYVRIESTTGPNCFPPYTVVSNEGSSVVLELIATDACANEDYVTERRYFVGSFQEGYYVLDVEFCVYNPPPFPSGCHQIGQLSFGIGGITNARPVPANDGNSIAILLMCIFIVSIARLSMQDSADSLSWARLRLTRMRLMRQLSRRTHT